MHIIFDRKKTGSKTEITTENSNLTFVVSFPCLKRSKNVAFKSSVCDVACVACRGTSLGLTHSVGQYERYRASYTNCTYVDGNLEIVFMKNPDDMSFLRNIREVTGYVLIVANKVDYIPLTSLRIIRGRTLYEYQDSYYSLFVVLNYDIARPGVGLKELRFTSMHGADHSFLYFTLILYSRHCLVC
jgi:hypothetical protein